MSIRFRHASPDDAAFVASLSREVFSIFGDYEHTLPQYLEYPGVDTVICEVARRPAAFIMLALTMSDKRGPGREGARALVAEVVAIAVAPPHQGRGIGRALLRVAERWALRCRLPVAALELNVAHDNHRAQGLFQAFGFTIANENDGTYAGGQRSIRMSRPLPGA